MSIGSVVAFAGPQANLPANWLLCNGAAVNRTIYQSLFNVIGTVHGTGDGLTTFNLPDYTGRFLRGAEFTPNRDPDKASRTAMATGGNTGGSADPIGSVQSDMFTSHTHVVGNTDNNGISQGSGSGVMRDLGNLTSTATGGNETRPENAYVHYIIRYV